MLSRAEDDSTIRAATIADAEAVTEIYNHYITQTVVTFEEETLPPSEIAQRINVVWSASLPWLVAEVGGQVAGYAYASKWHGQSSVSKRWLTSRRWDRSLTGGSMLDTGRVFCRPSNPPLQLTVKLPPFSRSRDRS